jgi:hypothetical protein
MARITISDLSKDKQLSSADMRGIFGGFSLQATRFASAATLGGQTTQARLDLQNDIQRSNRQFTMMSNIMKNQHDTAKAAINNLR